MKKLLLVISLIILLGAEMLRVYFIMPFPGSQQSNTIGIAYFLDRYIWYFRIAGVLLLIFSLYPRFAGWKKWQQVLMILVIGLYGYVFYMFNFKFLADKMFIQPKNKSFAAAGANTIRPEQLVIATVVNGEAKAYPIEIIGYHHQVQDTIGSEPVIVTYCTVCRTGRIYSPEVNGKKEEFRLVGMDHFNAMFEDKTTKSWWQQATGIAIAGPLKGTALKEIPSSQMSLVSWMEKYPATQVLQPDTLFNKQYEGLAGFDSGTIKSGLEKRDSASWKFKSWVVGVQGRQSAQAYDWNDLLQHKVINDSLPALPVMVVVEPDSVSFHAFQRTVNGQVLYFTVDPVTQLLKDTNTYSFWNYKGESINGLLKGAKLIPLQAYQEFWHSWQTFRPSTGRWNMKQ
jgi:hypothetical protein